MNEDKPESPSPKKTDSEGAENLDQNANTEFAEIFEEMVDLMQFAIQSSVEDVKGPLPRDLEEKLAKLENDVDIFCRLNEQIVNSNKILNQSPDHPQDALSGMSRRERTIYERSQDLAPKVSEKIELLKKHLKELADKGVSSEPPISNEERKKRYKRFGMREKWKKM